MAPRKIIVNIATSADGFVARPDGNLDWLTARPASREFYGLPEFERSIDAKILGRKTFERSLKLGARFYAPCATPAAEAYLVRSRVGSGCRDSIRATGSCRIGISTRQASATSLPSPGRMSITPGMARIEATCSIGWWVGPSSPTPIESCV